MKVLIEGYKLSDNSPAFSVRVEDDTRSIIFNARDKESARTFAAFLRQAIDAYTVD